MKRKHKWYYYSIHSVQDRIWILQDAFLVQSRKQERVDLLLVVRNDSNNNNGSNHSLDVRRGSHTAATRLLVTAAPGPSAHYRSHSTDEEREVHTGSRTRWLCASHLGPFGDLTLPADKCLFLQIFQFFRGKLKYVESAVLDWKLINKKGLDGKAEGVWRWEVSPSEGTEHLREDARGSVMSTPRKAGSKRRHPHTEKNGLVTRHYEKEDN